MKNKLIPIIIMIIIIFIPIINFAYPWRLSSKFPDKKFNELEIHEIFNQKSYSIKDEKSINVLYKYFSKQRGRKYFSWLRGGLHGLSQGDENYTFIFKAQTDLSEIINLIVINSEAYLSFTDGFYHLDEKSFNLKECKKLLNEMDRSKE